MERGPESVPPRPRGRFWRRGRPFPGGSLKNGYTSNVAKTFHGVVIELVRGREARAHSWLIFFEPDGQKSIPLDFEVPAKQVAPLLGYFRNELKGKIPDNYRPRPYITDRAYGLKDTLMISNEDARMFWLLSYNELLEARKLAK